MASFAKGVRLKLKLDKSPSRTRAIRRSAGRKGAEAKKRSEEAEEGEEEEEGEAAKERQRR